MVDEVYSVEEELPRPQKAMIRRRVSRLGMAMVNIYRLCICVGSRGEVI